MQIVPYPHPALRFKSVEITQIDSNLRKVVRQMFDLMYEAKGIGLAANQVGLPFRFFIVNLEARPGEPDEEMTFLNPIITRKRGSTVGEEGCLSLPGLYGDVRRAEALVVDAFDLDGQAFSMDLDDLMARVIQHETDHLDGLMFTDRMREDGKNSELDQEIPKFVHAYQQVQKSGQILSDEEILKDLKAMVAAGRIPDDFLSRPGFEIELPKYKE